MPTQSYRECIQGGQELIDEVDEVMRTIGGSEQNGIADVRVQQIGDFQSRIGKGPIELHLKADPHFWINRVTASYYGLKSVRGDQDVALPH